MLAPLSLTGNAARLGMGLRGATLGSVGDGAILGGAHGALNADEGKRWEEATSGAKFGAGVDLVAPLAISGVSNAFRRAVTPMTTSPERQAAADVLRNEGVGLSAGQTTGSKNLRFLSVAMVATRAAGADFAGRSAVVGFAPWDA